MSLLSVASSTKSRTSSQEIKNVKSYSKKDAQRFRTAYERKGHSDAKLQDFERITTLGAGTYGRVLLVRHKASDRFYALKVLDKRKIISLQQVKHTLNEKKILQAINNPFMIYMKFFFMDNSNLYFVLPFITGGEMFRLLKQMRKFYEDQARFYAAQVCIALEYLHNLNLVHRDLKPENILIDDTGYLKITDFGFCKLIKGRTYTFCGTPEYFAPEIILNKGYGFTVDWWSYGILIYEMNYGYPPFRDTDPLILYGKITAGKYKTPHNFSISLSDLLHNILQVDLSKRYGNLSDGAKEIKNHGWFKTLNWLSLLNKKIVAPYKPVVKGPKDTSNFDRYAEEPIRISPVDHFKKEFAEF